MNMMSVYEWIYHVLTLQTFRYSILDQNIESSLSQNSKTKHNYACTPSHDEIEMIRKDNKNRNASCVTNE